METWEERQDREHREMYVDFYIGKGPLDPPLTYRMASLEVRVISLEKGVEERQKRIEKKFNLILTGIISMVAAMIVELIFKR